MGQNSYDAIFVISRDSGFDAVVDFWTEKGYSIKRQESIVIKEKVVEEISEEQPKARPRRTYTRRAGNSGRTTTRTGRQRSLELLLDLLLLISKKLKSELH